MYNHGFRQNIKWSVVKAAYILTSVIEEKAE
jgi:hypothetical protein